MFHTSEKHSGNCKIVWRFDSYEAMDRMAVAPTEKSRSWRVCWMNWTHSLMSASAPIGAVNS